MCCIKIAPICVLIWVTGVKSGTGRPSSDHLQIGTILLTLVLYIVRMLTMNYCIQENMHILELKLFISLSSIKSSECRGSCLEHILWVCSEHVIV